MKEEKKKRWYHISYKAPSALPRPSLISADRFHLSAQTIHPLVEPSKNSVRPAPKWWPPPRTIRNIFSLTKS